MKKLIEKLKKNGIIEMNVIFKICKHQKLNLAKVKYFM
jgi:hypothetical protein